MRRGLLLLFCLLAAGAWAGWLALVRRTGDSRMVWRGEELTEVDRTNGLVTGIVAIENVGDALGVVRRVEGRIVDGARGHVLATLRDSRPPERGWWVSNILKPGESCVAEVDIHLDEPAAGPLTIELTAQEMGRRVFQYRTARLRVLV